MRIGVPKEIKVHEYRVGLVPAAVARTGRGGSRSAGADRRGGGHRLLPTPTTSASARRSPPTAEEIFAASDMIVKVKEPQPQECAMLRKGQMLYTYLHLAPDPKQTEALVKSGATCIAYETVTAPDGSLPLLTPMSEVAGRMSIQVGAYCLQKANGGRGILLGGVPGVAPAKVVILGGGVSGTHAAEMAVGLRADVTVVDRSVKRLRELSSIFGATLRTEYSTQEHIDALVMEADLVIGAVLIAGAAAPKLVTRDMVRRMKPGSVLVDISIDQGGCFETSKATTHADPTYVIDDVIHYCVANMPGAVPRTSTFALNNATLPFARKLADLGWKKALRADPHLANGLNVHEGQITNAAVAQGTGLQARPGRRRPAVTGNRGRRRFRLATTVARTR